MNKRNFTDAELSVGKDSNKRAPTCTQSQSSGNSRAKIRLDFKSQDFETDGEVEITSPINTSEVEVWTTPITSPTSRATPILKPSRLVSILKTANISPIRIETTNNMAGNNPDGGQFNQAEEDFGNLFHKALSMQKNRESFGSIVKEYTTDLNSEVNTLKTRVETLEIQNDELKQENEEILDRLDALEQFNRLKNLRITDVPDYQEEEPEDTVLVLAQALKINISPLDIECAYRIGKFKPSQKRILAVTFTNMKARRRFYKARTELARCGFPDVMVSEDLTPTRSKAAFYCRELKRQQHIKDTWAYEGEVFAVKKQGEKSRIVSTFDKIENMANVHIPRKKRGKNQKKSHAKDGADTVSDTGVPDTIPDARSDAAIATEPQIHEVEMRDVADDAEPQQAAQGIRLSKTQLEMDPGGSLGKKQAASKPNKGKGRIKFNFIPKTTEITAAGAQYLEKTKTFGKGGVGATSPSIVSGLVEKMYPSTSSQAD